jgi:hypothetical protein
MLDTNSNSTVLSIDERGLSIDTSKCPFRLPDGRAFQGVFRLDCLESEQFAASFKGSVYVVQTPSSRNQCSKIHENRCYNREVKNDRSSHPGMQFSVEMNGIVVDTSTMPLVLASGRKFQGIFKVVCPSQEPAVGETSLELIATFDDVASTHPTQHRSHSAARHASHGHEPCREGTKTDFSHGRPGGAARSRSHRSRSTSPTPSPVGAAARAPSHSAAVHTSSAQAAKSAVDPDKLRVRHLQQHPAEIERRAEPDTRELYRRFLEKRRLSAAAAEAAATAAAAAAAAAAAQPQQPPADDGVGRAASSPDGLGGGRRPSMEMAASAPMRARRGRSAELQRPRSASLDATRPRPGAASLSLAEPAPSPPPPHHNKAATSDGDGGGVGSGCGLGRLLRRAAAAVISGPAAARRGRH